MEQTFEEIENEINNLFVCTKLSCLLKEIDRNDYRVLILLLDVARYYAISSFTVQYNFLKDNLKIDIRTVKTSLEMLKIKNILDYFERSNYLPKKKITKEFSYYRNNIKLIEGIINLIEKESKMDPKNLTKLLIYKINELRRIYQKYSIENQDVIVELLEKCTNKKPAAIIDLLTEEKEKIKKLQSEFRTRTAKNEKGKEFGIYFNEGFLKSIEGFYSSFVHKRKEALASTMLFVFRDLPKNELLVLLFLLEIYEYLFKISKFKTTPVVLEDESVHVELLPSGRMIMDISLIASELNYDISIINRTILKLEEKRIISFHRLRIKNQINVLINFENINKYFDIAEEKIKKFNL